MSKADKHGLLADTMASGHLQARREPRYPLRFAIEVCGIGADSQPFRVRTGTSDVSEWGCRFEMPFRLEPNSIMTVQALSDDRGNSCALPAVIFQVVRASQLDGWWEIAAWKMGPEKVWPVELPAAPPEDSGETSAKLMRRHDSRHQDE